MSTTPAERGATTGQPGGLRRAILGLTLAGAVVPGPLDADVADPLGEIAESYVKLVLAVGVHDADYVDAYHGPAEWRQAAETAKLPLAAIGPRAAALRSAVGAVDETGFDEVRRLRREFLAKQLRALTARVEQLSGKLFTFDEESALLYDTVAPVRTEAYYHTLVDRLAAALPPGSGTVAERLEAFRKDFAIPPARLDAVFQAAIRAARERTAQHVALPAGESFTVEYVTGKPWGGYNWYQGGYRSLIQVNTDLPVLIDRALDLACHEGYPGHHVLNVLLEQRLVRERGWVEFSVYPLFSPQSLIAEGTANYGIEVAFPEAERRAYLRDVLYPLAGLDPARADEYERVFRLTQQLSHAGNEVARRYLDGAIDAAAAREWLTKYALMDPARAAQRVRFIDKYRSYVINYNHGLDLVRAYIGARDGGDPARRWQIFEELISSPRLPSGLR